MSRSLIVVLTTLTLIASSGAQSIPYIRPESFEQCGASIPAAYRQLFFDLSAHTTVDLLTRDFDKASNDFDAKEEHLSMVSSGGLGLMALGGTSMFVGTRKSSEGTSVGRSAIVLGFGSMVTGALTAVMASASKDATSSASGEYVDEAHVHYIKENIKRSDIEKSAGEVINHWAPALEGKTDQEKFELQNKVANAILSAVNKYPDLDNTKFTKMVTENVAALMESQLGKETVDRFYAMNKVALAAGQNLTESEQAWLKNQDLKKCSPETIEIYMNSLRTLIKIAESKVGTAWFTADGNLNKSMGEAKEVLAGSEKLAEGMRKFRKAHSAEDSVEQ